jgi:hypothetical protein
MATDACGNTSTCSQTVIVNSCDGCTPGFWKNHTWLWDQKSDPISACVKSASNGGNGTTAALFSKTFNLTNAQMNAAGLSPKLTLKQALDLGGGGFQKLARHGVASLLNSCAINFPMTSASVVTAVRNAIIALTPEPLATNLVNINEQNCPLGANSLPIAGVSFTEDPETEVVKLTAYPNPFRGNTTIAFKLINDSNVTLDVYSVSGKKVATLYEGIAEGGQTYEVIFNGHTLPDGIYIYRLNTPDQSYFDKLIIIK